MAAKKAQTAPPTPGIAGGRAKTPEDGRFIRQICGCEPLSWARYADGRLVFIAPDGRKNTLTPEEIERLSPKATDQTE
jgi:hypothetical protein